MYLVVYFEFHLIMSEHRKRFKDIKHESKKHKKEHSFVKPQDYANVKVKKENFSELDAFTRHKILMNYHQQTDNVTTQNNHKSEIQMLIENHSFVWDETCNIHDPAVRLAKKYYDKLVKEYCIADLRLYRENKIGMRWRTETEVIEGKGQFICGAKGCGRGQSKPVVNARLDDSTKLSTWEVFFTYVERNEKKHALVKLRLCSDCSIKLNYHHKHKKVEKSKSKKAKMIKSSFDDQTSTKHQALPDIQIKQEIFSEDEGRTSPKTLVAEENLWTQRAEPKEAEPDETNSYEQEIDDYLDQMFNM